MINYEIITFLKVLNGSVSIPIALCIVLYVELTEFERNLHVAWDSHYVYLGEV